MNNTPPTPDPQPIPPGGDWVLVLRCLPDEIPEASRMKSILKTLLRAYRIRCLSISERVPVMTAATPEAKVKRPRKARARPPVDLVEMVEAI